MENNFFTAVNRNIVDALKNDTAFFLGPIQAQLPTISNSFGGVPITGVNYFNMMLSNALNGTNHTEYVRTNEVLSSKPEWISTLPPENRPKGIVCMEESASQQPRYSFMLPTALLNQTLYKDNQNKQENTAQKSNIIPFQTSNTTMKDFGAFIQEQCTNAINASLTNSTFKSNIPEQGMAQFKSLLVNEIVKNPGFMVDVANKAFQEVTNQHYLPFDRKSFIEKARDTQSNEFKQLNSTIADHVYDMSQNQKGSFNHNFTELSRPLIIKIEGLNAGDTPQEKKAGIDGAVTEFVKEKIKEDKPAEVLTDTFAASFIEKTQKLAQVGKKVFAGVALVCSVAKPILMQDFQPEDFANITSSLAMLRGMKGDNELKTHMDNKDTRSFHTCLEKTLRENPQLLEQAISRLNNAHNHENTQSASISRK
jgi:predicted component of type VI protein secretion system